MLCEKLIIKKLNKKTFQKFRKLDWMYFFPQYVATVKSGFCIKTVMFWGYTSTTADRIPFYVLVLSVAYYNQNVTLNASEECCSSQ